MAAYAPLSGDDPATTPAQTKARVATRAHLLLLPAIVVWSIGLQLPLWPGNKALVVANTLGAVAFVATGVTLRHSRRLGWAWIVAGLLWPLVTVGGWDGGAALHHVAQIGDAFFWLAAVTALVLYPDGRLDPYDRAYVVAATVLLPGSEIVVFATSSSYEDVAPLLTALDAALAAATVALFVRRFHLANGFERRALVPVVVAVTMAGLTASVTDWFYYAHGASSADAIASTALVADAFGLILVPLSFLIAHTRLRLDGADVGHELFRLREAATLEQVRSTLRAALRDPNLDIVDPADGRPRPATEGRLVLSVPGGDQDEPLAIILTDPRLERQPEVLEAATAGASLVLLLARRAREEEIGRARRVEEARLGERRRIQRDLHDTAQAPLSAIAAKLAVASSQAHDGDVRATIDLARSDLRNVSDVLRDIAHGIHPRLLKDGLRPAVRELATRAPTTVRLAVPDVRFGEVAEWTVYCVVSEALANACAYAEASSIHIEVQRDGNSVKVLVADDGCGGVRTQAWRGLAGLHDRCRALGGHFAVTSPAGSGTTITVRIPCE